MSEVEFFNSAVIRVAERLVLKGGSWRRIEIGVRYGLLVHPVHGPVLIDTGYGPLATEGGGRSAVLKFYGMVLRPELVREELPEPVLAARGFSLADVKLVVLTHFHPDHVAGLRDFPNARFIASGAAWRRIAAMGALERLHHAVFMELLPEDFGERLIAVEGLAEVALPLGLGTGWDLLGDGSCVGVDLPGHGLGHFGVAWPERERPLLYAVDTQWLGQAVLERRYPRGPARLVYADEARMQESAEKVRRFAEAGGEVRFCHERLRP